MNLLCNNAWVHIEHWSYIIAIFTPIVLLYWFVFIQKQNYFNEILGIFAGYTDPSDKTKAIVKEEGRFNSGVIMNFRDVSNGYYRGEFDFRENISNSEEDRLLSDGFHCFYCKMNYKVYLIKKRNPLDIKKNRVYKGKLYILNRLDFDFGNQKIDDFLVAEYDVIHYREMRTLQLTLSQVHKEEFLRTPKSFKLHQSLGLGFEPYKNVKESIFRGFSRADKNIGT